ncbi:hypothetical protein ACXIUT_29155 [Achromobacter denitrificans]
MALKHAAFLDVIDLRALRPEQGKAFGAGLINTARTQLPQSAAGRPRRAQGPRDAGLLAAVPHAPRI